MARLSRRQALMTGGTALAALMAAVGAAEAAPAFTCQRVGQRIIDGSFEYTCVKVRGRLRWQRGRWVNPQPSMSAAAQSEDSSPAPTARPVTSTPIAAFVSALASVPEGGPTFWTVMDRDARPMRFALYRSGTRVRALSLLCTHAGCEVGISGTVFRCGCHGATYDATSGERLGGPAPRALDAYPTLVVGSDLYIEGV